MDIDQAAAEGGATMEDLFGDEDEVAIDSVSTGRASNAASGVAASSSYTGDQNAGVSHEDIFGEDVAEEEGSAPSPSDAAAAAFANAQSFMRLNAPSDHHTLGSALHLPELPKPAKGSRVHSVRLPRIVSMARGPFEEDTYDEAAEDAELEASGKRAAREALIRWRFKRDALGIVERDPITSAPLRESNSHVVQWADGSLTMHVGKEVFALVPAPADSDHSLLFARVTSAPPASSPTGSRKRSAGDRERETVLQAQAPISHRVTLRALAGTGAAELNILETRLGEAVSGEAAGAGAGAGASSSSSAAAAAGGATGRPAAGGPRGIRQVNLVQDPEAGRQARIAESESMASQIAAQRRKADVLLRAAQRGGSGGAFYARSSAFGDDDGGAGATLDEDDVDLGGGGSTSLAAIKKKAAAAAARPPAKKARAAAGRGDDSDGSGSDSGSDSSSSSGSDSDSDSGSGSDSDSSSSSSSGSDGS